MQLRDRKIFSLGRLRVFRLAEDPWREGPIYIECGRVSEKIAGFLGSGAYYFGIGRTSILWLTGIRKPKNVLELKNGKKS